MKRISKIGISLLIALCFLLPTGAVLADGGLDADITKPKYVPEGDKINTLRPVGVISEDYPVTAQATNTDILGFFLEACAGNDLYPVVGDAIIPFETCYEPMFKLVTVEGPSVYEPEIEIYKMNADQDLCIYQTSFEDNARNYMEWGQIDKDCTAPGGYYDGWAWSDARACGSDHSFKCTMYDEYKNMQDDVLYMKDLIDLTADEFELCDGTIAEVDTVGKVTVAFDIYVDGEVNEDTWTYSNPSPLDYLQFGIYDGTIFDSVEGYNAFVDSSDMPIDHDGDFAWDDALFWSTAAELFDLQFGYDFTPYVTKSADCPGWWHVEWELEQFPDMFGVFFEWRSDKERVFEGAYVDNVEIFITEDIGEKIYQGHSQNWLTQEEAGEHWFTFPLDWDDDIEVSIELDEDCEDINDLYYKAICKLKNDEGGYASWIEIDFEIGDIAQSTVSITEVEDDFSHEPIADGGIIQYPSDAHIKFCYTNNGNIPVEDVEITATGYKLVKETLFEEDFEGMFSWNPWDDDYGGAMHASNKFAWSGSKSLGFCHEETGMIVPGADYAGYCPDGFDMENVEDAVMDFYYKAVLPDGAEFILYMLGYYYVIITETILEGPMCQKTWVGPMQPQGMYESIDVDYWFGLMLANDYMKDENGHDTYITGIGFDLDCTGVAEGEFVPDDCFEVGETPWSGVYIDDISISATVKGNAVWTDSMILPGPCDPGDRCCDQFTWEDVPYCNYIIEVGTDADCVGDNIDDWEVIVLEDLEQASKVDAVDFTECDPEAWCISDVVGNDCGNDGAGDHYALATNCDTNTIPEDVNDYIGLEYIDVSHLTLYPEDYVPTNKIDSMTIVGLPLYYDGGWYAADPDTCTFDIEFYEDDYTNQAVPAGTPDVAFSVGPGLPWVYQGDVYSGYDAIEYTIDFPDDVPFYEGKIIITQTTSGTGFLPGNSEDGDLWSYQIGDAANTFDMCMDLYDGGDLVFSQEVVPSSGSWSFGNINQDLGYAMCDNFLAAGYLGAKAEECEEIFFSGFEGTPYDVDFALNTGWLDSTYGSPYNGAHHAYSWTIDDTLTTPSLLFGNLSTTLSFYYCAESATHPMDLEVYVDDTTLVYSDYGFTHTDYQHVEIPLGDDGLMHDISFVGMTSDYYGQCLDDVSVEACNWFPDPIPETDPIFVNMTYQCDIRDTMGHVYLEIATYEELEGGYCDGCEDPFACPAGVAAWETVAVFDGNAPGVCQYFSVNLADPNGDGDPGDTFFAENDTHFCLRFRLETDDPGNWNDIPGIGFHLHEMSISNILYDEILGVSDFYEDFEDANFVNEDSGMTWVIDCVTYGTHVTQCEDFQFCIADACPTVTPYECNTATLYGYDSYGDGWHGEWPYSLPCERFIDVYVNGVLVVDAFTLHDTSAASTTFDICPGDVIDIDYYTPTGNTVYIGEESWELVDGFGTVLAEDGPGPVLGVTTINVITEIYSMTGTYPAEPIDEAIVWSTEIEDAYEAYLTANWAYDIGPGAILDFEISADGGDNWFIIAHEEGPKEYQGAVPSTPFDLTPWAGNSLLVRVHLENAGVSGTYYDGYVCVDHIAISGKQDMLPPTASVSLSGNSVGPGMYAGPVTVTITAVDDMAMGEIHYTLDGVETVVSGSTATFKVSDDGDHTVTFYPVDATGNVGSTGSVSFSIDNSPPTVSITAPEPGLYLLGNKLLGMSKVFIIGAFTAEATADDAQGVAVVQFLLNGEVVGEDTTAPYDAYIAVKNMGAATLKVIAEDGVGNTAEDSMDITYYKFL